MIRFLLAATLCLPLFSNEVIETDVIRGDLDRLNSKFGKAYIDQMARPMIGHPVDSEVFVKIDGKLYQCLTRTTQTGSKVMLYPADLSELLKKVRVRYEEPRTRQVPYTVAPAYNPVSPVDFRNPWDKPGNSTPLEKATRVPIPYTVEPPTHDPPRTDDGDGPIYYPGPPESEPDV